MVDMVLMVVEVWLVVGGVIVRAELEYVRQSREQEQQELQHQLLGRADADHQRQQPHHLDFDDLDNQHDRQEGQEELILEEFLCEVHERPKSSVIVY